MGALEELLARVAKLRPLYDSAVCWEDLRNVLQHYASQLRGRRYTKAILWALRQEQEEDSEVRRYTGAREGERKAFLRSSGRKGITEAEVSKVVRLGRLIWGSGKFLSLSSARESSSCMDEILDNIIQSEYFRYQNPAVCSKLVQCLNAILKKPLDRKNDPSRDVIKVILMDVLEVYRRRYKIHSFWPLSKDYYHPWGLVADLRGMEDEHVLTELIKAIKTCSFTRSLMTSRPPKSICTHQWSLLECMEHAFLWMHNSPLPIYNNDLPLPYSTLRAGQASPEALAAAQKIFAEERVPRSCESSKRRHLVQYKLYPYNMPEWTAHKLETYVKDEYESDSDDSSEWYSD